MSDKPEVKTVSDNNQKFQWATGLFYGKDGPKKTLNAKRLKIFSIAVFIILSVFMLLSADKEPPLKAVFSDIPQETDQVRPIDLNSFQEEERPMEAVFEKRPKRSKAKKRKIIISRLSIVSREEGKIPPGLEVRAKLLTAATDGTVKAVLTENLEGFGEVFMDEGATLLGKGNSGKDRLFIKFHKMIQKDGRAVNIEAQAYDLKDRTIGLRGKKLNRRALKYLATTGLHFLAGVSQGLRDRDIYGYGVAVQRPSVKNALLQGAGTAALNQSQEIMESFKNEQNIIHVKPGVEILIVFEGNK